MQKLFALRLLTSFFLRVFYTRDKRYSPNYIYSLQIRGW